MPHSEPPRRPGSHHERDPLKPVPLRPGEAGESRRPPTAAETALPVPQRRIELARILWDEPSEAENLLQEDAVDLVVDEGGEATTDRRDSSSQPLFVSVEPEPPEPSVHAGAGGESRRSSFRRHCSFPGILRVLVPENSFQPRKLAVRIIDISRGGARMETRQLDLPLMRELSSQTRFARLEALVPAHERIVLNCSVVWVEFDPGLSQLGVRFEYPCEEVDDFFVSSIEEDTSPGAITLTSPVLDPFPTVTSRRNLRLSGRAAGAEELVIRNRAREFRVHVHDGRFEALVELVPDQSNFISLTAQKQGAASVPTPVCVVQKPNSRDTITVTSSSLVEEFTVDPSGRQLQISLSGEPKRFFQVFNRLSRALEHADDISLTFELRGDAKAAARQLSDLVDEKRIGKREDL